MSLRGNSVQQRASLPDGRTALIRVAVPEDGYLDRADVDTVALEIWIDERVAATVNTVLDADQESEALELASEVVAGLEAGELEPTAGDLEALADRLR